MFASSVVSGAKSLFRSTPQDADSAQGAKGIAKPKGKAAASAAHKPKLPEDKRYNASPLGNSNASLQRVNAQREHPELVKLSNALLSSKLSRQDPIPDTPSTIPTRLQEKVNTVDLNKLAKLDPDLHQYAKMAVDCVQSQQSPPADMNTLDKKMLPLIAKAENQRNPGLNLQAYGKNSECYDAIKQAHQQTQKTGKAQSIRVVYPPIAATPRHHIALDVQLKPGRPPSIVAFDAADNGLAPMLEPMLKNAIPDVKVAVVDSEIQASEWDCIMFATHHAVKMHKHHDDYTAKLHKGKELPIPGEFLKHTHSKTRVQNNPMKDEVVTKDKSGIEMETLEHRNMAYRTQRGDKAFSTSIEGFRLQEIRRAGEYLAAQQQDGVEG